MRGRLKDQQQSKGREIKGEGKREREGERERKVAKAQTLFL